jgi:hypothetical protein
VWRQASLPDGSDLIVKRSTVRVWRATALSRFKNPKSENGVSYFVPTVQD